MAPKNKHLDQSELTKTALDPEDIQELSGNESLIGQTLGGRYLIEKEIGRGGVGAVYLARDKQMVSRPVVVKVLLEESLQNDWARRKFRQEIEALTRIDHPGIVGAFDAGELPDGKPYLVMQYIKGCNLRSAMRPEGMDLERTAGIIKQVGNALTAAHEQGVYHRDLKPENVMIENVDGEDRVKVIDFGIAKIKDSVLAGNTETPVLAGTVAYMSPEQLAAKLVSEVSDIYSLGVIAYEMVTGRRPFNPSSLIQLSEMQREGVKVMPKDLRPTLPRKAQEVILKALSFNPTDRYHRARDFSDSLAHALSRRALRAASEVDRDADTISLPGRDAKPTIPKRVARLGFVLALALLAAGVIGVVVLSRLRANTDQPNQQNIAAASAPSSAPSSERKLSYSLMVQKMRNNKPYQEPFESSGQEIFENGWKFRLNISSPQPGFLYLLNEGPTAKGSTTYNVLFPDPAINAGSAELAANQAIQTGWYLFDQHQGTEKFWMVWSAQPVAELEAVRGVVNPRDKGAVSNPSQVSALREFFIKSSASKPEVEKDRQKKQTNVRGQSDMLVNPIELEHH